VNIWEIYSLLGGLAAIATAVYMALYIARYKVDDESMLPIYEAIREGARAFLKRQYKTITYIAVIITIALYLAFDLRDFGGTPYISMADLVGKVEAGIPEDDPRNPAVIADNVGDNVGDVAGRGADLFESMSAENIGAMIIGIALSLITGDAIFIIFPLLARATGIFATLLGTLFVRGDPSKNPFIPLRNGMIATTVFASSSWRPWEA